LVTAAGDSPSERAAARILPVSAIAAKVLS